MFSYSGDPENSTLDRYRFLVGDTDSTCPIMQDQEIMYIVNTYTDNENMLLYQLFSRIAILFARDIKRSLGPQSEDPAKRTDFFKEQAEFYRKKASASGLSIPNYQHPKVFHRGMHNNPPYTGGAEDV